MRVTDAALQQILANYKPGGLTGSQKSRQGSAASSTSKGDEISISQEGQFLQRMIRAAQDASDVRAQRVDEIRTQIRTGAYVLDSQAIANKMLGIGGD